ncbi:uncharacterized protein [Macrobrachium rosenbergii]|uniref:uncharacterized protein n=1 Tax=Macrobrachium rosenbergii TaxID=79674 RepID=UPI0034D47ED5
MSSSAASHVIPSDGLLKFRYYYFVRHFGKDVTYRVYKYCFLHGNSKTIRQILEDNGVVIGRKGPFNNQEITNLTTHPPEHLDITLLNKICQTLWQKMVNYPGDKLRDLIKKIKDERNNVSHEETGITQGELESKLLAFGATLEEAIDEAISIYPSHGTDFDQLKLQVQEAIPKIQEKIREKYDASNPDHVDMLKAEMEEFADQLHDYIREKSREELVSLYKVLCRILPFDWLTQYGVTDPCEIMVSLRMDADEEFHAGLSKEDPLIITQEEVLDAKNPSGEDPKVIILSGGAGSGKTTMMCSTVEKWCKHSGDITNLASFEVLLYMEFRKDDYDNFETYIRNLLQRTVLDFNYDLVKSAILHSKCLILCDGFDEANKKSTKLFEEILRLNCKYMKVLVTTRPMNTIELTSIVNKSKHLRINLSMMGIRKEAMESHIKTLVAHLWKKDQAQKDEITKEITKFIKTMNANMNRILRNPLWFNLFVLLYIECPALRGKIYTVSSLYIQLKKHNKKRLVEKCGIAEDDIEEFEPLYKKWSLLYYLQQKYELSQRDTKIFKAKLKELDLDFNTVMSSYFNIKHATKDLEVVKVFCYRHRSEQEFIAASVICDELVRLYEDEWDKFDDLVKSSENIITYVASSATCANEGKKQAIDYKNLDGLLPFISGLLYDAERDILYSVIDDIIDLHWKIRGTKSLSEVTDTESFIKYFTETGNDANVVKSVVKKLQDIYGGNIGRLYVTESESLVSLPLLLPEVTLKKLSLSLFGNPDDFSHLIPTLTTASQCRIAVLLAFQSQWHDREGGNADIYLAEAKTCTRFKGKLTEYGIRGIPKCLGILRLRTDLDALRAMSNHIQELSQLRILELKLHDDGSCDPGSLSPIDFTGEEFTVEFSTSLDVAVESNMERMARVLNAFWPPNRKSSEDEITFLFLLPPSPMNFTEDGVKLLSANLTIQPLSLFKIFDVVEEAFEKEKEYSQLFKDKGLGLFQLSKVNWG